MARLDAASPVFRLPMAQKSRPTVARASWAANWRSRARGLVGARARHLLGACLNRLGAPAAVQNTRVHDPVAGRTFEVDVGTLFTRISVDGRDFYFNRLTGRFDGSGTGCG